MQLKITLTDHRLFGIEKMLDRAGLTDGGNGFACAAFDGTNTMVDVRPRRPVHLERDMRAVQEVFGDIFVKMIPVTHEKK